MNCENLSYDNRETCTVILPSSCVPFVGSLNDSFKEELGECRPNINDILQIIQDKIDSINEKLGDNTTLDEGCLTFNPATATQAQINQAIIIELCALKETLTELDGTIDPTTIMLAVDLLCLEDPACEPETSYNLLVIINKLLAKVCNLETRVAAIETFLNL